MAAYSFIDNTNDFFATGYFTEDFQRKVFDKSGYDSKGIKDLTKRFSNLRARHRAYLEAISTRYARESDVRAETHSFNSLLLSCLGYYTTDGAAPDATVPLPLGEGGRTTEVPVRVVCSRSDDTPQLYILDIPPLTLSHETGEVEGGFVDQGLDRLVTHLFALPEGEHPRYLLLLGGSIVFFMDADKWQRGAYLRFDIGRLLVETTQPAMRDYFALFYLLISREALAATAEIPLMQQLEEESYKSAYSVTQDLKLGVVSSVEELANEAIYYIKQCPDHPYHRQDETDDHFEEMMRDDCLVLIYRLLFIFYAESRPDLEILPISDPTYQGGYSLEMLRDLEQVPLITAEMRDGYFFDDSMKQLFHLILAGYHEESDPDALLDSFRIRHIDSPLFSDTSLRVLGGVRFRNQVWQEVICSLSLSRLVSGRPRGRISYANLGINQLGSVYENLLAYRGFYAEEDYIEVHPAGDPEETYLQLRSRRDDFCEEEILKDAKGNDVIHPRGQFVYRLNGRDRKRSASYYTPEVLTKSTVRYTLRPILQQLEAGEIKASELLEMKILEPAMGAAAFQNEVINQLAILYLTFRAQEVGEAINPLDYPSELQKVKAYIATNNVYGVDLNATAIELGKLSLWLNVMHKDMEVPFFSNRLALGNAVIGAWLRVYKQSEVETRAVKGQRVARKWWEATPRRISFGAGSPRGHYNEVYQFLLPMPDMLPMRSATIPTFSVEEAQLQQEAKAKMKAKRSAWLRPISPEEYKQLIRISKKVDRLLREYVEFQLGIAAYANNGYQVWRYEGRRELPLHTNAQRQELDDVRYRRSSPYTKLRMVMDYWCSLFFWELGDADKLPTRQEYWADIERILDVDVEEAYARRSKEQPRRSSIAQPSLPGLPTLFDDSEDPSGYDALEAESAVRAKTRQEILSELGGRQTQKLDLEGVRDDDRLEIVQRLSSRYHFFHPMLEFLEVFWLRDGFDIICGNPPWVKVEFLEKDIIAEQYPEVALRKMSAPAIRRQLAHYLEDRALRELYLSEMQAYIGTSTFLNSISNYPLLEGQQANLYKCILENTLDLASPTRGYIGLLTPESIYDDPKGQPLRRALYPRLRYHFQYQNELLLFAEITHLNIYGIQTLGPAQDSPSFISISNLYHPATVDGSLTHNGESPCGGIKDQEGRWNTAPHRDRVVRFTSRELQVLSETFEDGTTGDCAKLVRIHSREVIEILEKLSEYPHRLSDYAHNISSCFHETGAVDNGLIDRDTHIPDLDNYDMIYNGPSFHVGNPLYKTPREQSKTNSDYDALDLTRPEAIVQRSNYRRVADLETYRASVPGLGLREEDSGVPTIDSHIDYYKAAIRGMLAQSGERTLICAVLPRKTAHIHGVVSVAFRDGHDTVDMAGLFASLPYDFFTKTIGITNVGQKMLDKYPMAVKRRELMPAIRVRALLSNCLTEHYAELWDECWDDRYREEEWTVEDPRLSPFDRLHREWSVDQPLRNRLERRQALVELDVLASMALGLTLEDLEQMYTIQFPVLQKNESDTWYDQRGEIVFTISSGLTGVGCDRREWESIRGEQSGPLTYLGTAHTHVHTISPDKSKLYGGEEITYIAPYTRCDRIADYRRAWAALEQRFGTAPE